MPRKTQSPRAWWDWHGSALRDPADVFAGTASGIAPGAFETRTWGKWDDVLASLRGSLVVTREYEHLVIALRSSEGRTRLSYIHLAHPSGIAVDVKRRALHVACSRNPNQLLTLTPALSPEGENILLPETTTFLPGRLHLHDLALIGNEVYAAAPGINAVVKFEAGRAQPVWWPRVVDRKGRLRDDRNYLQLNSIAAGASLRQSFFTASTDRIGKRLPGDPLFSVDGHGVVFSGKTRDVIASGLTRPHSAVLRRGRVWLNNSGYGQLGYVEDGQFRVVAQLSGWTRGLAFAGRYAFVGISRVLPRFESYAPGLTAARCRCGVEVVDVRSGEVVGGLHWPTGNQIFAVAVIPDNVAEALPFAPGRASLDSRRHLAHSFVRSTLNGRR